MDLCKSPTSDLSSPPSTPSSTSTTVRPRCEPDPLDPNANLCLAKVTTDDRQGISHFFGRNKKATASIPEEMFPLLCRTHYQEKQYRWKEDLTAFAAFQCDCVLKTLERMSQKTFVDADGIEWPYWCGFELQLITSAKDDGSSPKWLRSLCQNSGSGQTFTPIGDRYGVRYSFIQLETIVKAIKTWCLQENAKLPAIEALPVTIGMVDEVDLEEAKKTLKDATRKHTLAVGEAQRHSQSRSETTKARRQQLQSTLRQKVQAVNAAQASVNVAQNDSNASKPTLPTKRQAKKVRAIVTSPSTSLATSEVKTPSEATPGADSGETQSPVAGKRRIVLKYNSGVKRPKIESD